MSTAKRLPCWVAIVGAVMLCTACDDPEIDPPNILLISVDTLRADHLGSYGRSSAQTPNIDALAEAGVVFDRAVSPVPLTLPSHTTMLTGLAPPRHGVRLNTESRLAAAIVTLPERLLERGYRTGAFVGADPLAARGGLARGFEVYDEVRGSSGERLERSAKEVFDTAREWIGTIDPDRRVFAFIHVFDPHWPLDHALPGASEPSYDGEIAYVDRQLGAFLSALPDTPRWRDVLTVIVSDHGEGLGEHGETSHGLLVYESTLRVPWIVHRPSAFKSRRVSEPVGLVDLAPTLIDLAAAEPLSDVDGESLAPVLTGSKPAAREFYFESLYGELQFGWAGLRGLRVGALKYTAAPRPELYDLAADPGETVNLHASRPDDAARLRRRLEELGEGTWTRVEMDPEELARLSSLGYVSARPATASDDAGKADPKDRVEVFDRFAAAVALAETGRHGEAYARLAALEPDFEFSPHFHLQFGDAAAGLERWDAAQRRYERVLTLDGDHRTALENLAVVQLKTRAFDAARATTGRLLSLDPDHVNALYLTGSVEIWSLGELESGIAHWRRLLELAPDHARAGQIRNVLDAFDAGQRTSKGLRERFRATP